MYQVEGKDPGFKFYLIDREQFNLIKYLQGAVAGENTQEASDRISILQDEINRLDQHEKMLDQHKVVSISLYCFL